MRLAGMEGEAPLLPERLLTARRDSSRRAGCWLQALLEGGVSPSIAPQGATEEWWRLGRGTMLEWSRGPFASSMPSSHRPLSTRCLWAGTRLRSTNGLAVVSGFRSLAGRNAGTVGRRRIAGLAVASAIGVSASWRGAISVSCRPLGVITILAPVGSRTGARRIAWCRMWSISPTPAG